MNNTPYETLEQQALFDWAKISGIPDLDLLHAIPNGGHRNKATAGRLKAEGVKRGVPDISCGRVEYTLLLYIRTETQKRRRSYSRTSGMDWKA